MNAHFQKLFIFVFLFSFSSYSSQIEKLSLNLVCQFTEDQIKQISAKIGKDDLICLENTQENNWGFITQKISFLDDDRAPNTKYLAVFKSHFLSKKLKLKIVTKVNN